MTNGNESATPYFFSGQDVNGEPHTDCGRGLTKREYMATEFMRIERSEQSLTLLQIRHRNLNPQTQDLSDRQLRARLAIADADALIEALNQEAA